MRWRTLKGPRTDLDAPARSRAPHEILDVPPGASEAEIKAAYKREVRAYHPDRAGPFLRSHSEEMMKRLNEAYRAMRARLRR